LRRQSRRRMLVLRNRFLELWDRAFPKHDPVTGRRYQQEDPLYPHWEPLDEHWKRAARAYGEERNKISPLKLPPSGCKTFEQMCDWYEAKNAKKPVSAKLQQLRRLMGDEVSLDRAWHELNNPQIHPTPNSVVEAIWWCVRERGTSALEEPVNKKRYQRCDKAARAEIARRIAKLQNKGIVP